MNTRIRIRIPASRLRPVKETASLFLCLENDKRSAWRFLDDLPIPTAVSTLVADYTSAMPDLLQIAEELREAGMLGHQQEVLAQPSSKCC